MYRDHGKARYARQVQPARDRACLPRMSCRPEELAQKQASFQRFAALSRVTEKWASLFLALPQDKFQVESVDRGGPDWVERYLRLCQRVPPRVLAESKELPRWLVVKKDYDIWQRNNL